VTRFYYHKHLYIMDCPQEAPYQRPPFLSSTNARTPLSPPSCDSRSVQDDGQPSAIRRTAAELLGRLSPTRVFAYAVAQSVFVFVGA